LSNRANPAIIGGFVLGAIALLVVAVLVFGGGELFSSALSRGLFDGSVKGCAWVPTCCSVACGSAMSNIEAVTDPST
jgi:hypothetical protein